MIKTMNKSYLSYLSFISLMLLFILTTACGKTGMPQPQDPKRNFTIAAVSASPEGKNLFFEGQLAGAYENLDSMRLEIQSIDGVEDCPECPFVANEVVTLSAPEIGFKAHDGSFGFSYSPHAAKAYRWKMLGISKFSSVPHASSYEMMTDMYPEPEKERKESVEIQLK